VPVLSALESPWQAAVLWWQQAAVSPAQLVLAKLLRQAWALAQMSAQEPRSALVRLSALARRLALVRMSAGRRSALDYSPPVARRSLPAALPTR